MRAPSWLTARPIAHRGLHDAAAGIIENTLPAIEAAIAGNYAIEVDIWAVGDGDIVVFHDDTLDRLTTRSGPLKALNAKALSQIPFRDCDARIPSLDDLLACVDGQVPLIIEIKTDRQDVGALERRLTDRLKTYRGPAAVMSFDPHTIRAIRHLAPALPRGITSEAYRDAAEWPQLTAAQRRALRWMIHLPTTRPHFVAYSVDDLPAVLPSVLNRLGLPLLTWTVRTPAQRAKAEAHADQVIFEDWRPD